MMTKLSKTGWTFSNKKSSYYALLAVVIAFALSLLFMIPALSNGVAELFTDTKEGAKKLGKKIRSTAQILAFTLSGLMLISLTSFFLPISATLVLILGLTILGVGVYSLFTNWEIMNSPDDGLTDETAQGLSENQFLNLEDNV